MSWTAMTGDAQRPPALWGWRGDPDAPRPSGGFWAVVTVVLPVVNVIAAALVLDFAHTADAFFAAMAIVLATELGVLHRWLGRAGLPTGRWLRVAGSLIVVETAVVLFAAFVAIIAIVASAGGN
jgi:hypothetical protein